MLFLLGENRPGDVLGDEVVVESVEDVPLDEMDLERVGKVPTEPVLLVTPAAALTVSTLGRGGGVEDGVETNLGADFGAATEV